MGNTRNRWATSGIVLLLVSGCVGKNSPPPQDSDLAHSAAPLGNSRIQTVSSPVARTLVTDPDHDSVWIIPGDGSAAQQIALDVGDEPGDLLVATTPAGDSVAYVSLHNGGALLAIPLTASKEPLTYSRLSVCGSPRGLDAYPMSSGETLFVACADGDLVALDVATSAIVSRLPLADDLKDVVVLDGVSALVTRFRSAQVLLVNLTTGAFTTSSLPSFTSAVDNEDFGGPALPPRAPASDGGASDGGASDGGCLCEDTICSNCPSVGAAEPTPPTMVPDVAWQMIPIGGTPRLGALIAHQLASVELITVAPPDGGTPTIPPGCDVDNGGCAPNAACTDTANGPTCACPSGFVGDGLTCVPPGPCLAGSVTDPGCLDGGFQNGAATDGGAVSQTSIAIPACSGGESALGSVPTEDGGSTQPNPPAGGIEATADGGTSSQQGYGPSCGGPTCGAGVVGAAATFVSVPAGSQTPVMVPVGLVTPMIPPLSLAVGSWSSSTTAFIAGLGSGTMAQLTFSTVNPGPQGEISFPCVTASASDLTGLDAIGSPNTASTQITALFRQQPGRGAQIAQLGVNPGGDLDSTSLSASLPYSEVSGEAGRNLFHSATPSMMSCASCHPNGRDDSHVWSFAPMGQRRTPALGGGLLATAPFHWDGSEHDLTQLMTDVFVGRMEGPAPSGAQVAAISGWLNGLPEAHAAAAPAATAVAAGQKLFESSEVGCTTCHSGEHFTNNETVDVGTGGAFQVPSLRGVGSRPPYLHDGRAATLEDRFDPTLGGGDLHGHTSQLTAAQIEDLVAYLRSL